MDPMEIYKDLREKIIWHGLKPGQSLNIVELAKSYEVSRTPVTIALTRLDAEKWVVKRGAHHLVSPLTIDVIRDTVEIRSVLEVQANIWAMHRLTSEGLDNLKRVAEQIVALDPDTINRDIIELDLLFHRIIYRETQNTELAEYLERILNYYLRFWLSSPNSIDKERFFQESLAILQAIEKKDEVALRTASTVHIKASLDEIMGLGRPRTYNSRQGDKTCRR